MKKRSSQDMKSVLGFFLLCGWIAVILYSSYRIELGLTDIGYGFILFLKRMLDLFPFARAWDVNWMEDALHMIVHIEAFILLGVFAGAATRWWGIKGRKRLIAVVLLGLATAIIDEGYQWLVLRGAWVSLDLVWELIAVVIGLKIEEFVAYSNR